MRLLRRAGLAVLVLIGLGLGVLAFPQPLFAYRFSHGQYDIWSDRPIDPALAGVLDDATRRLRTSELYNPEQRFRIFLCNEDWRLAIYSQRLSSAMGGAADTWLTRNIYLRESVIADNRIVAPGGVPLADAEARPMAYFIAHEATHILESRAFGRFTAATTPRWLFEGYADLVGKGGEFDIEENRRLLVAGDARLDPLKSGLYRRYHLMTALLLERQGRSVRDLFAAPPEGDKVLEMLRKG